MQSLSLEDLPFNLELSVSCGQAFRWRRFEDSWYAPDPYGSPVVWKIREVDGTLRYDGASEQQIIRYFALDHNLPEILSSIDCDPLIHAAIVNCFGLRVLRQDPWECLISYTLSSCSNIPGIQRRIENLSQKYGHHLLCDGHEFYSFPEPNALCDATLPELRDCRVGYRDTYLKSVSEMVVTHPSWVSEIGKLPYLDAQQVLCTLDGVGPKVADCVLLFGFGKLDSVPVDVWIERILRTNYFGGDKKLPYKKAGDYAREHFGSYAGYAQEYLFASRKQIPAAPPQTSLRKKS